MKLSRIVRLIVEEQGIEYLVSDKSSNFFKDMCPNIPLSIVYLWQSMLRDLIIEELLKTNGTDFCIHKISYKFSVKTGFSYESVFDLLKSVTLGIKQAYWGIRPKEEPLSLSDRFLRNKTNWMQKLSLYKNGILRVLKDDKYGFITSNGDVFINPMYKSAGLFNEGLACVHTFDNRLFFINILGNIEIELNNISFNQTSEVDIMYYGISKYQTNGKYGLISNDGNYTDCIYDWINIGRYSVVLAYKDGKCGLITKSGLMEKTLFKYDQIDVVNNSNRFYTLASYSSGEKVILDYNGNETPIDSDIVRVDFINDLIFMFESSGRLRVLNKHLDETKYYYGVIIDDRFGRIAHRITIDTPNSPLLYYRRRYGSYSSGSGFIFIKSDGKQLEKTPYIMAHQYNNGIAWLKRGSKWYRVNSDGEQSNMVQGFDILTPEYNCTVLARDLVSGLIVLLSFTGEITFTIPNTEDIDLRMNRHYQYIIETPEEDFIWYKGVLTKFKGKIDNFQANKMLMYSNYLVRPIEKSRYEIYDLDNGEVNIILLKSMNDRIRQRPVYSKIPRGNICCETHNNKFYILDIHKNTFSEEFDEILGNTQSVIGRRDGQDFLIDSDLKILCSYNQITTH